MSAFKWTLLFLLVFIPLFLLTAEYMGHLTTVSDAETATRSSAQAAVKANLVRDSLRDTDVEIDNHVIHYNSETIQEFFDDSVSRKVETEATGRKGYITIAVDEGTAGTEIHSIYNPANPYPMITGFQPNVPMLAIRTNVVRKSFLYEILGKFAPTSEYYNIQNQKIAILEVK